MWAQLAIALIFSAISYALTPKVPVKSPTAADKADVPSASEGTPIPVIFGRVLVKSTNVTWYGALKNEEIRTSSGKK